MHSPRPALLAALAILLTADCASHGSGAKPPAPEPLMTAALAGAAVIVPPLTMVLVEQGLAEGMVPVERPALLLWADSLVGTIVAARAPEVHWVLAPELRRVARRSPGVLVDPDQMGQAVLRQSSLRSVPDPLRGYLRNLMALAGGGRYAFIPAAVVLAPFGVSGRVSARLAAVLADGRSGAILWRTEVEGTGANPAEALSAAFAIIFPAL